MASTISYANVAAAAGTSKSDSVLDVLDVISDVTTSSNGTASPAVEAPSQDFDKPEVSELTEASTPASPPQKMEKKVLAPAPVPTKSVWGAAPQEKTARETNVDEHKWPTPDKVSQIEQSTPSKATKFIKPNKWVPINAKVVLPSPRNHAQGSAGSQQKNKRKNKTQKKSNAATGDDSIIKKDDKEKSNNEVSGDAPTRELEADATESEQGANGQLHNYNEGYQKLRYNNQNASQKNYKRFAQNGHSQNGKPAQLQQPRAGYYPQFVPGQYQNYPGGRQFKPYGANGSQYPRKGTNANIAGYGDNYNVIGGAYMPHIPHPAMMGMPFGNPMPVQIPPPISPEQNPQQALTQQIDYYFSLDNLIRDVFLRKNMGTEGWVELDLILNFKRIKIIVNGIHNSIEEADLEKKAKELDSSILHAVQQCQNVEIGYLNGKEHDNATATEVQLRVKASFEQWLLPDN